MMDKAQYKLNKIIDILEKELKIREYSKQQKAKNQISGPQDFGNDSDDSGSDEGKSVAKEDQEKVSPSTTCFNILNGGNIT